jgi:hypothetical protein
MANEDEMETSNQGAGPMPSATSSASKSVFVVLHCEPVHLTRRGVWDGGGRWARRNGDWHVPW